jgi:N-acetylmuramoyl-L-alanine amidase
MVFLRMNFIQIVAMLLFMLFYGFSNSLIADEEILSIKPSMDSALSKKLSSTLNEQSKPKKEESSVKVNINSLVPTVRNVPSVPTSPNNSDSSITLEQSKLKDMKLQKEALKKQFENKLGSIVDVNLVSTPEGIIKLIFEVDKPFMAELKVLNFPFRLMMDIPMPYQWSANNEQIRKKIPVNLVNGFRYGSPSENVFRVITDLARPISLNRAYAVYKAKDKYELIIEMGAGNSTNSVLSRNNIVFVNDTMVVNNIADIADEKIKAEKDQQKKARSVEQIKSYLNKATYKKPSVPADKKSKIIVFLDPGHGGKDPGATSFSNSLIEKSLVLDVSKQIKDELEKNNELSVVMTRDGDYYLPLKDRILWAEYLKASLFVSIHADKAEVNSDSAGLSIYYLSDVASDAQAQLLANNTNQSDLVAGVPLTTEDESVNRILISLSQRVKINESTTLAKNIISKVQKDVKVLINPIRSAGFAVLKVPNTASVLVELGFLSNDEDVKNLKNEEYQAKLAKTISLGIQSYLWEKGSFESLPLVLATQTQETQITEVVPPEASKNEDANKPKVNPAK